MTEHAADRYDFYAAQYARFGSKLAAAVRQDVYGADLGQQGWRSIAEQKRIIGFVSAMDRPHVLDVGCGSGGPSIDIARATGCRLVGVDVEPTAIATANAIAAGTGIVDAVAFHVADCDEALPFENAAFDRIICIDAVLHFRDRAAVFSDWFRLLRPGGRLLMTDAAVITGPVAKHELDVRASQGAFTCVPLGCNESALKAAGFAVQDVFDTTPDIAAIASRTIAAREKRADQLRSEEGSAWYERRQAFLTTTAALAGSGRLSRFLIIAHKPA